MAVPLLTKPSLIEPSTFKLPLARSVKVPASPSKRQGFKFQPRSATFSACSLTETVKSPSERTSMPGVKRKPVGACKRANTAGRAHMKRSASEAILPAAPAFKLVLESAISLMDCAR